ncbi:MAG: dienelactone hydrolase family protein [Pseudomonadota bacterium]
MRWNDRRTGVHSVVPVVLSLLLLGCGDTPKTTEADDNVGTQSATQPEPKPAEPVAEPEALTVATIEMPYGETDDGLYRGHFAYPEAMVEPLPAVIVIHDWWGLDDATKNVAERLAGQGYMVLAVDLFNGQSAKTPEQAGALSMQLLEQTDAAEDNLRAAHQFLTDAAGAPVVATFGTAMGGYWSFKSSRILPDALAASVMFYGQFDTDQAKLELLNVPLLAIFAGDDASTPKGQIKVLTDITSALDKPVNVHVLPRVKQGFANPDDARFDARAAQTAWELTLSFLAQHLQAP